MRNTSTIIPIYFQYTLVTKPYFVPFRTDFGSVMKREHCLILFYSLESSVQELHHNLILMLHCLQAIGTIYDETNIPSLK